MTIAERFGLDKGPFGRFLGRFARPVFYCVAAGLLASGSFGLGVIYAREEARRAGEDPGFWIEELPMKERAKPNEVLTTEPTPVPTRTITVASSTSEPIAAGGEVVGSKNGTAYYLPWCSGAKRISPENLVTFPNKEAAEAKGYKPAKNCKGI